MKHLSLLSPTRFALVAIAAAAVCTITVTPWCALAQPRGSTPAAAQAPVPGVSPPAAIPAPHPGEATPFAKQLRIVGRLTAQSVCVETRIDGVPIRVVVVEGQHVKAGDLLVQFDQAELQRVVNAAEARVDQAAHKLQDVKSKMKVETSASKMEFEDAVLAARLAEFALDDAQTDLSRTDVKAPIDGVITRCTAKLREFVAKETPVVIIMDTSYLTVEAHVPEGELAKVHVGQKLTCIPTAYPDKRLSGEITFIAPTVEHVGATTYCRIKASIKSDPTLKPGMTVSVEPAGAN